MTKKQLGNPVAERPAEVITGFVAAIIVLARAFGVDLTDAQSLAVLGVVGFMPAIITLIRDSI